MLNLIRNMNKRFLARIGNLTKRAGKSQKNTSKENLLLGRAEKLYQRNEREDIYLSIVERLKHLFVLGSTGAGKTKLIEFLIRQDILGGQGFCLIDPHGDLYQRILNFLGALYSKGDSAQLSEYLSKKLVIIDPTNSKWNIGFNPLEANGINPYSQVLEFMGIFKKLWADSYWGPRMEEILRNTLITLSVNNLTLLEAKGLLICPAYRNELIDKIPDGEVKDYWVNRYNMLSEKMQMTYREPVLNRISMFVTVPFIRGLIGQVKSTIDFRKIMDEGKWLLINLSKGELRENAYLLGALIIAKLQLSALSRVDIPEERRTPFLLYVDEFQNFIGKSFEIILSEARKYGLGLILAHQNLDQLDKQLRSAILGNVATQVFFRLSHHDASTLAAELSQKEKTVIQRRLTELKTGEAYISKKGERPRLMKTIFVPEIKASDEAVGLIKEISFSRYGRLRNEVEEEIRKRADMISDKAQVDITDDDPYKGQFIPKTEFEEGHDW